MATASTASPMDVDTNNNHSIVDTKKHHHHHHHHKEKLAKDSKVEVTRKASEDEKLEKRKKDHGESKVCSSFFALLTQFCSTNLKQNVVAVLIVEITTEIRV